MNPTIIPRLADPTYDGLVVAMQWHIPDVFNMGAACADIATPESVALVGVGEDGRNTPTTFGELSRWSGQLAAALKVRGVARGDRIGIVAPQSLETGLSHLAVWKLGAISLPLASLFGPDALEYRLHDAGARMALVSPENVAKVREASPGLELMVLDDDFWSELQACDAIPPVATLAEDPAFLIYTSGTTGPPKGAPTPIARCSAIYRRSSSTTSTRPGPTT